MYEKVKTYVSPEDTALIQQVINRYKQIPVDTLPHCLVHGDFTKANVLKDGDGQIFILDFSVANWYPRIQELAVAAANLLNDPNNPEPLTDTCETVLNHYTTYGEITESERDHLYNFALAGLAMEFLGAHQEKYLNHNDLEETEFWLNLGRDGLMRELDKVESVQ